jgi:hypothetical protein
MKMIIIIKNELRQRLRVNLNQSIKSERCRGDSVIIGNLRWEQHFVIAALTTNNASHAASRLQAIPSTSPHLDTSSITSPDPTISISRHACGRVCVRVGLQAVVSLKPATNQRVRQGQDTVRVSVIVIACISTILAPFITKDGVSTTVIATITIRVTSDAPELLPESKLKTLNPP